MAKFFINRPIVSIVIALLMVIAGGITIFTLPTAQFPNITDPQVQVSAFYPGADSETIAQSVATPIAQQMAGVDGMNYMYSQSASTYNSCRPHRPFAVQWEWRPTERLFPSRPPDRTRLPGPADR